MLPQDPVILLSVVNARLRDLYPDLDELCHSEDADRAQLEEKDRAQLEEKLAAIDYHYNPERNQFL